MDLDAKRQPQTAREGGQNICAGQRSRGSPTSYANECRVGAEGVARLAERGFLVDRGAQANPGRVINLYGTPIGIGLVQKGAVDERFPLKWRAISSDLSHSVFAK